MLANAIGAKRIKLEGSSYVNRGDHIVINWGNSRTNMGNIPMLNPTAAVKIAANKLFTFLRLSENEGINIPPFTTDPEVAASWDKKVVVRHTLTGHSGDGIEIIEVGQPLPAQAPLYTQYIPKREEYRVHVFNGQVIDQQRKMRDRSVADENVNWQVRNLNGGFIFGREGVELPPLVLAMCTDAVRAVGLDFGAVDIVWNEREDKYYVLEINTACGLTGTTLENYANAIRLFADSI